jgi:hypothetical protein
VIEAQRRRLGDAEFAAGQEPAMTSFYVEIGIDQHWHIEAEGLDAVGDLPDLLLAVAPRVGRIRRELVYLSINNRQIYRDRYARASVIKIFF